MPMTCARQSSQNTDFIEKIIAEVNTKYLEICIGDSLDFLQAEFFADGPCEAIERLRGYAGSADTAHAHKVGIFFLLLNIDRTLKQKMMDGNRNHRKLVRFFSDLRRELVTDFFCSAQPVVGFALRCREGYLIA